MRYDINILWVEDAEEWQRIEEKNFLQRIDDELLVNIDYIGKDDIPNLPQKIQTEANGYKNYDIMFIDYNIGEEDSGNKITGDNIIDEFRKRNIDADILFYSDKLSEEEEKEKIKTLNGDFDGIYLAKRNDFQEKAIKLFKKNSRKLTSILNIRGFLADKTSENDFVMKSYLLEEYNKLSEPEKTIISKQINSLLTKRIAAAYKCFKSGEALSKETIHKSKDVKGVPDFLFPIKDKYEIFFEMLKIKGEILFSKDQFDEYKKIIDKRNTVAHKKIDLCKQQKYLKYYDNIRQFKARECPPACNPGDCKISEDCKISLDEWKELLKETNEFSVKFDGILQGLREEGDTK